MQTDRNTTSRQPGAVLTRSRRRPQGNEPPPAAGAALPPGVTRAMYLSACAEVHTLDRAVRQLGLQPQPQSLVLQQKLSALSAELAGGR